MTPDMRSKLLGEEPVQAKPAPEVPQPRPSIPDSLLSSKFTSSGTTLTSTVTTAGLQSAVAFAKGLSSQQSKVEVVPPKPAKVFTRATRDVTEWHPEKLLCKRFGVDVPYPTDSSEPTSQASSSSQSMLATLSASFAPTQASMQLKQPTGPAPPEDKLPTELTESTETPAMDLFKAIFETPAAAAPPPPAPEPPPVPSRPVTSTPSKQKDLFIGPEPPPGFVFRTSEPEKINQEDEGEEESLPMMFPQPPPGFVSGASQTDSTATEKDHKHHHHHSSKHRSRSPDHKHHHKHHKHHHKHS